MGSPARLPLWLILDGSGRTGAPHTYRRGHPTEKARCRAPMRSSLVDQAATWGTAGIASWVGAVARQARPQFVPQGVVREPWLAFHGRICPTYGTYEHIS